MMVRATQAGLKRTEDPDQRRLAEPLLERDPHQPTRNVSGRTRRHPIRSFVLFVRQAKPYSGVGLGP